MIGGGGNKQVFSQNSPLHTRKLSVQIMVRSKKIRMIVLPPNFNPRKEIERLRRRRDEVRHNTKSGRDALPRLPKGSNPPAESASQ